MQQIQETLTATLSFLFWAFCLTGSANCAAPTLTPLYEFTATNDGSQPTALAPGADGVLYGVTNIGGAFVSACSGQGCGTVYSLTPPASPGGAWTEQVLWSFGGAGDGQGASGLVLGSGGVIYGIAGGGGAADEGIVFSLAPPASPGGAWTEQVLWSFGVVSGDGAYPTGWLALGADGVLYGTTLGGTTSANNGSVFSLTPPALPGSQWTENVIWSFGSTAADGAIPRSGVVVGTGGALYGATQAGGTNGSGTLFALTPPASLGAPWTEAILHNFGTGGRGPGTPLTMYGGAIYGSTINTNHTGGKVFSATPPKFQGRPWLTRVLFTFPIKHRMFPRGGILNGPLVVQADGAILGTSFFGGGTGTGGVIFKLAPPAQAGQTWTERSLYKFQGPESNPVYPNAGLVKGSGGILYGTTTQGGSAGRGAVFSFRP